MNLKTTICTGKDPIIILYTNGQKQGKSVDYFCLKTRFAWSSEQTLFSLVVYHMSATVCFALSYINTIFTICYTNKKTKRSTKKSYLLVLPINKESHGK